MPLIPFLEGTAFGPDEVSVMVGAYEAALRQMDLTGRADPRAVTLAKSIVVLGKNGERDPVRMRERAIELVSGQPPDAAGGAR
jgi:hypothetical protein